MINHVHLLQLWSTSNAKCHSSTFDCREAIRHGKIVLVNNVLFTMKTPSWTFELFKIIFCKNLPYMVPLFPIDQIQYETWTEDFHGNLFSHAYFSLPDVLLSSTLKWISLIYHAYIYVFIFLLLFYEDIIPHAMEMLSFHCLYSLLVLTYIKEQRNIILLWEVMCLEFGGRIFLVCVDPMWLGNEWPCSNNIFL